jgi:hypothetical protein
MSDQLNREIEIPGKRIPWIRYFFQIALPALIVSIKATAQKAEGKVKVNCEKTETKPYKNLQIKDGIDNSENNRLFILDTLRKNDGSLIKDSVKTSELSLENLIGTIGIVSAKLETNWKIAGKVVDEKNDPLPGTTIKIKGTHMGTASNNNGEFNLHVKIGDVLEVSGAGLVATETKIFDNRYILVVARRHILGGISIKRVTAKKELKDVSLMNNSSGTLNKERANLFPNPVFKGGTIFIETKCKSGDVVEIQLANLDDKILFSQSQKAIKGSNRITINTDPRWSAGIYIVRIYANGKLSASEKIVIQ